MVVSASGDPAVRFLLYHPRRMASAVFDRVQRNGNNDSRIFPLCGDRTVMIDADAFCRGFDHFPVYRKDRYQADVPQYLPHGEQEEDHPDHRRVLSALFYLRDTLLNAQWLALVYVPARFPDHDTVCRYRGRNRLAGVIAAGTGKKNAVSVFGPSYRRDLVRLAFSRVYRSDVKPLRRQYHRIWDHDFYLGVCFGCDL